MKGHLKNNLLTSLFLLIYLTLIYLLLTNQLMWFDLPITTVIQSMESSFMTGLMKFFSFIGSTFLVILIIGISALIFFFFFKLRKEILFLILTSLGSAILNVLLKHLFKRERPSIYRLVDESGYSFPSGHSMAAFTLYFVIAYLLLGKLKSKIAQVSLIAGSIIFIIAIGYSRIYLGVHYPSDIIAGYLTSFFWLLLCINSCKGLLNK